MTDHLPDTPSIRVALPGGHSALVDAADAALLTRYKWLAVKRHRMWYAQGHRGLGRRNHAEKVYLHRLILGVGPGVIVDHVNADGLDCRRCNIRVATQSQNNANARKTMKPTSSRFKGVHRWHDGQGHWYWKAQIKVDGRVRCAYRKTEEEAARAYDDMATEAFGAYARTNFGFTS